MSHQDCWMKIPSLNKLELLCCVEIHVRLLWFMFELSVYITPSDFISNNGLTFLVVSMTAEPFQPTYLQTCPQALVRHELMIKYVAAQCSIPFSHSSWSLLKLQKYQDKRTKVSFQLKLIFKGKTSFLFVCLFVVCIFLSFSLSFFHSFFLYLFPSFILSFFISFLFSSFIFFLPIFLSFFLVDVVRQLFTREVMSLARRVSISYVSFLCINYHRMIYFTDNIKSTFRSVQIKFSNNKKILLHKEAHRPLRSKYTLRYSSRGYPCWGVPPARGYSPLWNGVPPIQTWEGVPSIQTWEGGTTLSAEWGILLPRPGKGYPNLPQMVDKVKTLPPIILRMRR